MRGMMHPMTTHAIARIARPSTEDVVPAWTLGDRMRKALAVSGTPVNEIADYLGVTPTTVGRWINDRSPVKRPILMVWAATTGVSLEWLETGTAGLQEETGGGRYAIRDSNPEPADMASRARLRLVEGGNPRLPVDRIPAGHPIPAPSDPLPGRESAARLWAVS